KRAFARALARDPADRFATATEFVDAIRSAMPEAAARMPPPLSSTRKLRLAVNRQPEPDPMAVLQQPRFADLDVEPDHESVSRGPSILSLVDDHEDAKPEPSQPFEMAIAP